MATRRASTCTDGLYGDTDRAEVDQASDYERLLERIDDILWETPQVDEWSDEQRTQYRELRDALRQACERIERGEDGSTRQETPWPGLEAPTRARPEAP
ncbi:MAG: hypothetical protein AAF411_21490 [Myxococcota bacterium]